MRPYELVDAIEVSYFNLNKSVKTENAECFLKVDHFLTL